MSSSAFDATGNGGGRLGGARADFVASLGRKVGDAREILSVLEDDPSSAVARDELRRRLHALGTGSRLLRFDAMARSLQEVLAVIDRGAQAGALREPDVAFVAQVLDDLPALAWGETPPREVPRPDAAETEESPDSIPTSVLVVGDEALAETLTDEGGIRHRAFECERTEDVQTALELARAYAPDLVVVDVDLPRAMELVESLLEDPLTEPVPILVLGTFRAPDDAARFVALGVARTLAKPVTPQAIRAACDDVLDARAGHTMRVTLGEPTLDQLVERLVAEVKRGLLESVDAPARSCRVPLGEGTEVLGAMWGAIARVQEIIAQRTAGAVRFGGDAPEGAIALAPWLHQELPGAERMMGRGRGAAADVRLTGRRVVIADDDPGVTWFISDLLRTAGCEVYEALDGTTALKLAFRIQPELIVSDILMPGLDGFALCRSVRRDVALRDTQVILLSWKEDLLQRVRELGASAAAYMRKETDSRAILARVREVLRPRARIEMRLKGDGEVRGRLDDLSPRLLLDLVCSIRKDARVAVRDATFLYEIDVRGGAPRRATRTASDGSYLSGERALANLLGVGAGRFVVSPNSDPVKGELTGTLFDQLARPIAAARGALVATTGARTMDVERILLQKDATEEYLRATPDPARAMIGRLVRGESPRQMLLAGEASPSLLEDVLSDLAARCAIRAVEAADGTDLLGPAVEDALTVLKGGVPPSRSVPPNARPSAPIPVAVVASRTPALAPRSQAVVPPPPPAASPFAPPVRRYETLTASEPPPAPSASQRARDDSEPPSSLEDAVMRELSDRSPDPGAVRGQGSSGPPPIIEPSELRPRSSNPPANEVEPGAEITEEQALPSIPPDAIVPATSPIDVFDVTPLLPMPADALPLKPPSKEGKARPAIGSSGDGPGLYESPFAPSPVAPAVEPSAAAAADGPAEPAAVVSEPSRPVLEESRRPVPVDEPPQKPSSARLALMLGAFGMLGIASALAMRGGSIELAEAPPRPPLAEPASASAARSPPDPTAETPSAAPPSPSPAASSSAASADDVPPGAEVPAGFGLVEVTAAPGARLRVDGALIGNGPLSTSIVQPGYHEVVVEHLGRQSKHVVEVRAGKVTRVRSLAQP